MKDFFSKIVTEELMKFKNRIDAAERLLPKLQKYSGQHAIIVAIPRGAVPMAVLLAEALQAGLKLIHIKKIGHPKNPELAIGSVSLQHSIIDKQCQVDHDYIQNETEKIRALLRNREKIYNTGRPSASIRNKVLILVDDGIATGHTMLAAVQELKRQNPARLILAVPVASAQALRILSDEVDEIICLHSPDDFLAVGEFYEDFSPISDEEAMIALRKWQNKHKDSD